jgi:hypothetical protein
MYMIVLKEEMEWHGIHPLWMVLSVPQCAIVELNTWVEIPFVNSLCLEFHQNLKAFFFFVWRDWGGVAESIGMGIPIKFIYVLHQYSRIYELWKMKWNAWKPFHMNGSWCFLKWKHIAEFNNETWVGIPMESMCGFLNLINIGLDCNGMKYNIIFPTECLNWFNCFTHHWV